MDNTNFDWLDGDYALNYETPEFLTSDSARISLVTKQASPAAERASPAAEQPEQPSDGLPLLRLSNCMTKLTLNVSTITFDRRSPNVRISELGMFVQTQIPTSS